jgi:hypothetical protein
MTTDLLAVIFACGYLVAGALVMFTVLSPRTWLGEWLIRPTRLGPHADLKLFAYFMAGVILGPGVLIACVARAAATRAKK